MIEFDQKAAKYSLLGFKGVLYTGLISNSYSRAEITVGSDNQTGFRPVGCPPFYAFGRPFFAFNRNVRMVKYFLLLHNKLQMCLMVAIGNFNNIHPCSQGIN